MFCINETLISIKPGCKDAEAFALLTRTCWVLNDAGTTCSLRLLSLCPNESIRRAEPDSFQSHLCAVLLYEWWGLWGRGRVHCFNDMQYARILKIIFTASLNTRDAPLPQPPTTLHPPRILSQVRGATFTRHPPVISHTTAPSRRAPTLKCGEERQAVRVLRWLP